MLTHGIALSVDIFSFLNSFIGSFCQVLSVVSKVSQFEVQVWANITSVVSKLSQFELLQAYILAQLLMCMFINFIRPFNFILHASCNHPAAFLTYLARFKLSL